MKNCRFCGALPCYPTKAKKNKIITACPNIKCPIFSVFMTIKQWESELPKEYKEGVTRQDGS